LMAGLEESLGHVSAHAAQSDHAELHSWSPVDLQISVRESTNANTLAGASWSEGKIHSATISHG
jgi:hypothetical protein